MKVYYVLSTVLIILHTLSPGILVPIYEADTLIILFRG